MQVTYFQPPQFKIDSPRAVYQPDPGFDSAHLLDLVEESKNVLLSIATVFPFDLFTDTITIDENKVNIIQRNFFGVYNFHSIFINDITDISLQTNLLFATLTIIDSSNFRFPIVIVIRPLYKKDAIRARRLIQGLIAAKQERINLGHLSKSEVFREANQAGEIRGLE